MAEKRFEKTAVYMFAFSILASGINYLFQILAGRLLSTAEYGLMNSAFSIVNIVTVLGVALGLTMAKTIAEDKSESGSKVKSALLFTMFLAVPTVVVVFAIMHFSNYKTSYSLLCATAIALINITYVFYGTIQGQKKYLSLSLYNLILPCSKLLFGIAMIYIGLSSASVFIAMIIGAALCFIFGCIALKSGVSLSAKAEKESLMQILRLLVFTLISTACLTFFNNVDILFIRHFFPEDTLGLYSAASLFGKIILYVPSVLVVILVPVAAENKDDGRKTMLKSLLYSFCISCIASAGLFIIRKPLISIVMGERYLDACSYILPLCAVMLPLVLITVLFNYLIAVNDKIFVAITGISTAVLLLVTVAFVHNSPTVILMIMAIMYSISFIASLIRSIKINV